MDTEITLDKIDLVRDRTQAPYARCYAALEKSGGDVVHAVIEVEQSQDWRHRMRGPRGAVAKCLTTVAREAKHTRITVHQGDRKVVEVPGLIGAVGTVVLPVAAAAGILAAFFSQSTIRFERRPS